MRNRITKLNVLYITHVILRNMYVYLYLYEIYSFTYAHIIQEKVKIGKEILSFVKNLVRVPRESSKGKVIFVLRSEGKKKKESIWEKNILLTLWLQSQRQEDQLGSYGNKHNNSMVQSSGGEHGTKCSNSGDILAEMI